MAAITTSAFSGSATASSITVTALKTPALGDQAVVMVFTANGTAVTNVSGFGQSSWWCNVNPHLTLCIGSGPSALGGSKTITVTLAAADSVKVVGWCATGITSALAAGTTATATVPATQTVTSGSFAAPDAVDGVIFGAVSATGGSFTAGGVSGLPANFTTATVNDGTSILTAGYLLTFNAGDTCSLSQTLTASGSWTYYGALTAHESLVQAYLDGDPGDFFAQPGGLAVGGGGAIVPIRSYIPGAFTGFGQPL